MKFIVPAIWVFTSALLLKLASSWNELPERVAVHFNSRMQPNRWGSKDTLGIVIVFAVLGQAGIATWVLLTLGNAVARGGVVLLVVNVVLVCTFWQVINYNTRSATFRPLWIFLPLIALLAGMAVFLAVRLFG